MKRESLSKIMRLAWQMVKRNGYSMSEALHVAWLNFKLTTAMAGRVCKFYFQKVDGSIREAFGTLKSGIVPDISAGDSRKKNDTVQVYFDTEKNEWRCYKRANLLQIC